MGFDPVSYAMGKASGGGGGGGGVPLMTRAEWNALSISEKQQYGLVGVEDYDTGYYRGTLYYGANYDLKGEAEATNYCRLSTTIGDGASFSGRSFTRTSNEPVIFCGMLGSNRYNSYCVISTSSTAPAETHNDYGNLVSGGTITVQGVTLYVYVMSGWWAEPLTDVVYTYEGTTLHFTDDAYIKEPTTSGAENTVGGASAQVFMALLEMYAAG